VFLAEKIVGVDIPRYLRDNRESAFECWFRPSQRNSCAFVDLSSLDVSHAFRFSREENLFSCFLRRKSIYIYICIYRSRGLVWKQFHFADLMERLESLDLFFCNVVFLICSFRSTDWPPYHTRQLLYHLRIKSKLNYHVKTLSFPWFISSTRRFSRFLANGSVFPTPPRFRGNHNKRT